MHDRALPLLSVLLNEAERAKCSILVSEVNLGEVFYSLAKRRNPAFAEAALETIAPLPIQIVPVQPGDAMQAARLKARFTISYADCYCANLAIVNGAPVVTGDPDFQLLEAAGVLQLERLEA